MQVITQKNLKKLLEMGFDIGYKSEDNGNITFIRLFHKVYPIGIVLYSSLPEDDEQTVYMGYCDIDGKEFNQKKGRNVVSNAERWLKRWKKENNEE